MVCVVAIFATALAGCAETPIDRSSVASLRSIALVGPSDPAMYSALNSTVGIIGAVLGGWLWAWLHLPGIGPWWVTSIISATVGACILLFILRLIKR